MKKQITSFLNPFFSALGPLWIITQIIDFFGNTETINLIKSTWVFSGFLLLAVIYAIIKNIPKKSFSFKIPNRDAKVNLVSKDIFKIEGSLIITINNHFLINQDGVLLQSNSILSQFVKKYYHSKPELLQTEINNKLAKDNYNNSKISKSKFKIGTTVLITIGDKSFYFLANTKLNEHKRSCCNREIFEDSLNGLWVYLSESASKEDFIIPLIGTGNGRLNMNREKVYKEILLSFLSSLSSKNYADSLTICIKPSDKKKHINLSELVGFTNAKVTYQEYKLNNGAGQNAMPT